MDRAFVRTSKHDRARVLQPDAPCMLSAQWAFLDPSGQRSPYMVDAHTGRVRIDD